MIGVYRHIPELFGDHVPKLKYKAGDTNKSVVKMWQEVQKGWKPPSKRYSKKMFEKLKDNDDCSATKGFVGFAYTYRGIFLDGYFDHSPSKINTNRDRVLDIGKQVEKAKFTSGSYAQFSSLNGYVIYCDPPYDNTTCRYYDGRGYKDKLDFDSEEFWKWCREMATRNIVFVSEYIAPQDVKVIWEKGDEKLYLVI
jgi:site-specific DNA-adenine methylase